MHDTMYHPPIPPPAPYTAGLTAAVFFPCARLGTFVVSAAAVFGRSLQALVYLHLERKIHRDVKAGNILVASDGSVR